jgi:hypothetical protein
MWKVRIKINLRPDVKYDYHPANFPETKKHLKCYIRLPCRILSKSDKNEENRHKFYLRPEKRYGSQSTNFHGTRNCTMELRENRLFLTSSESIEKYGKLGYISIYANK